MRMVPQIFLISVLAFIIIQLPPGDYLTEHINRLRASGRTIDQQEIETLTRQYGLDRPAYERYFKWMVGIVTEGDFGYSYSSSSR
jgi:peptide/nickel transport system permease protein